jgi:hypothetical protein
MVKIVNLVLFNDNNNDYCEMYKILSKYYKIYNNVTTYFYKYNNAIENDFELIDDVLNIKGNESFVPGILNKTLEAFKYIDKNILDYDYIIRVNISSIIDYKILSDELEKNPMEYWGGTNVPNLSWYDPPCGIVDNKYFGIQFSSGTNIIISKNGMKILLDNINLIDKSIIDDVAIGILFTTLNIKANIIVNDRFVFVPMINSNEELDNILAKQYIVYRNKQHFRHIDVIQMKMITSKICELYT